jgi:transcriptional regulator with XRE-family HTH domain
LKIITLRDKIELHHAQEEDIMASFQNKFKELRVSSGLTQQEMANKMKVSQSTITMWENGKRQPDLETLEMIADYFNVDMNFLTGSSSTTTRILDRNQHRLISLYEQLNAEGQEKLLDYAADIVASGRYIKSDQSLMVEEA